MYYPLITAIYRKTIKDFYVTSNERLAKQYFSEQVTQQHVNRHKATEVMNYILTPIIVSSQNLLTFQHSHSYRLHL